MNGADTATGLELKRLERLGDEPKQRSERPPYITGRLVKGYFATLPKN